MEKTTIELTKKTRNALADLKDSKKESFEEVIKFLLEKYEEQYDDKII